MSFEPHIQNGIVMYNRGDEGLGFPAQKYHQKSMLFFLPDSLRVLVKPEMISAPPQTLPTHFLLTQCD